MSIEPDIMHTLVNAEYYSIDGRSQAVYGCQECGAYYGEYENRLMDGCKCRSNACRYLYAVFASRRRADLLMFTLTPYQYLTRNDPTCDY